ncbi:MAG: phosphate ABC transporter substrate-binding/OmpA family protein [Gammaproteobacteria bacterium]|nr:phosphate ABC transporter substrate-binding/OmpA family protein [Gammaproteobacteria bacterium]
MHTRYLLTFVLFTFLTASSNLQAANLQLRIQGSNTVGAQLAPKLAEAWLEEKGYDTPKISQEDELTTLQAENSEGISLEVAIEAKGSSFGFKGLQQRTADLGMSSRRIKQKEIDALSDLGQMTSMASEHVIALDGIAVILHPNNPLDQLDKSTIRDIFSGKINNWKKIGGKPGAINLYARDDQSGTYEVFKKLVLGKQAEMSNKAKRFADNAELSAVVTDDPFGIGFVGLPYILQAKALSISDGEAPAIAPSRFSVATEDYALSRRLYMYTPDKQSANPLALEFIDFVYSAAAQRIIAEVGFITQQVFLSDRTPGEHYPQEMRELAEGAKRLSVNMRFAERTVFLDNKAKRDADRVYQYLKDNGKLMSGLLLFGFAEDKPEGLRSNSLNRSVRRADQVAKYLAEKGVRVATSRGYGGKAPVASNDTAQGQEKNRRVELWIK